MPQAISGATRTNSSFNEPPSILTPDQRKVILGIFALLALCAIVVMTVLAIPQVDKLNWKMVVPINVGIGLAAIFALCIYCKKEPVVEINPVISKPVVQAQPKTVNPVEKVRPQAKAKPEVNPTLLGNFAKQDWVTGSDATAENLNIYANIALEMFFDHFGNLRPAFQKIDRTKHETIEAIWRALLQQNFPNGHANCQMMANLMLGLSDENLGRLLLMMQEIEKKETFRAPSAYYQPSYVNQYVNTFSEHQNYQIVPSKLDQVIESNGFAIDQLPLQDLGECEAHLHLEKLDHPVVRLRDAYGRSGFAFHITNRDFFSKSGVLAIYQRFANAQNKWTYSCTRGLESVNLDARGQVKPLSIYSLSLGHFSFGTESDYQILDNLLKGRDPLVELKPTR